MFSFFDVVAKLKQLSKTGVSICLISFKKRLIVLKPHNMRHLRMRQAFDSSLRQAFLYYKNPRGVLPPR